MAVGAALDTGTSPGSTSRRQLYEGCEGGFTALRETINTSRLTLSRHTTALRAARDAALDISGHRVLFTVKTDAVKAGRHRRRKFSYS